MNMYLALASIAVLVILIILTIFRKAVKKRFNKNVPAISEVLRFEEDPLIDTKYMDSDQLNGSSTNKIYETTGKVSNIVKRYMIHQSSHNTSLIYEYGENVTHANLLIYFFNQKRKLFYIYRVSETVTSQYSHPIEIPKDTSYVNFVEFDEEVKNHYHQQFRCDRKLLIYDSISLFLMMFVISFWTVFILTGNLTVHYYDWSGLVFNLILIIILTVVNFAIKLHVIQRRNPYMSGGNYE